jgi:hypothetical protein
MYHELQKRGTNRYSTTLARGANRDVSSRHAEEVVEGDVARHHSAAVCSTYEICSSHMRTS